MLMIAQILSVVIFVIMFALIISEKFERHIVTLVSGAVTLFAVFGVCMHSMSAMADTINLRSLFELDFWYLKSGTAESSAGVNWATIIFIAGMMIMVEGMARAGFFRWLCIRIAQLVRYRAVYIFIAFMLMAAGLSMFIDSITVILFLAAVTVELAQLLSFNPVPMILAEIFCANLGGSATMCGDPPNIIIGTSLGYSFHDFIENTGAMAGISLLLSMCYFYLAFHKELDMTSAEDIDVSKLPTPESAVKDKKSFLISSLIFFLAVALLITHAKTGLTVAFIGLFIALLTLATSFGHIKEILKGVDYKTLLFFIGLFVVIGGLEQTGVLELVSNFIGDISDGNKKLMIAIILWLSAIASAFVDNIPFAATMIPVIRDLSATQGVPLSVLAWTLSMGTDIGGSATPIGASANVVGTSVAAKSGYPIGWGRYCKKLAPITVLVLLVCMSCIYTRYF
jgi:Na+/H+ antiporter NhaD/arsenite permease-like protein